MKINTTEAEEYINYELGLARQAVTTFIQRQAEAKWKYESSFFPKLFGWKYEKSMAFWSDNWDTAYPYHDILMDFGYEILYAKKYGKPEVDVPEKLKLRHRRWMIDNCKLR
jgi:hypothetical protein